MCLPSLKYMMQLTESIAVAIEPGENKRQLPHPSLKDAGVFVAPLVPNTLPEKAYKKSSSAVNGLAVSQTHFFAVQSGKAAVNVYSRERGNQELSVFFPEKITSITIQDDNIAILGMANGGLQIWELHTGRSIITNRYHTQAVSVVRFHTKSNLVLSGSDDTNVQIWDLTKLITFANQSAQAVKSPLQAFTQHRAPIADVVFGHGPSFSVNAMSAGKDGTIHIWNPHTAQLSRTILVDSVPTCLELDPMDRALYVGSEDGGISSVDLIRNPSTWGRITGASTIQEQSKSFTGLPDGAGATNCLLVSYDSTSIVSGHAGGKVYTWDVAKRKVKQVVIDTKSPVTSLLMVYPETAKSRVTNSTVVKPKPAEYFALSNDHSTSGIPGNYNVELQLLGDHHEPGNSLMPSRSLTVQLQTPRFFTGGPFAPELINEGLEELRQSDIATASTPLGHEKLATNDSSTAMSGALPATEPNVQARVQMLEKENDKLRRQRDGCRETISNNAARRLERADKFENERAAIFHRYAEAKKSGIPEDEADAVFYKDIAELFDNREANSDEEELAAVAGQFKGNRYPVGK